MLGLAHDGPADGHALALAAGERLGLAVEQLLELQDARRLRTFIAAVLLAGLGQA
jgi:hypothetical protein